MPAPGGRFAGAPSSSRGYAGYGGSRRNYGRNDTPSSGRSTGSQLGGNRTGGTTGTRSPERSGGNTGGAGPSPASRAGAAQAAQARATDVARAIEAAAAATARGQRGLLGRSPDTSGTGIGGLLGSNANRLAELNRMDRSLVERGTTFGNRYGVSTAHGISLMDPERWNVKPGVNLENVDPSLLTKAISGQLIFGKPLNIVEGWAPKPPPGQRGIHVSNSQHYRGKALDLHVPAPTDRAAAITAMTQAGIVGTGTYPNLPYSVHVDLRNAGAPTWGKAGKGGYAATPDWHADARLAGLATAPDWDSIVSGGAPTMPTLASAIDRAPKMQDRTPAERTPMPQPKPADLAATVAARNALTSLGTNPSRAFPGAPAPRSMIAGRPEYAGAFPAEDAQPSTFPGRPGAPPSFNSQVASRPERAPQFASMWGGRQEFPGTLPGAPRSTFPSRPEFAGAFPPEDRQPSSFPGRESPPGFMSRIAGLPGGAPSFNSRIAGRPGVAGPGFPAATPQMVASAPEEQEATGGGWFDGLGDAVNRTKHVMTELPGLIRDKVETAVRANPNDPASAILGGWSNPVGQQNELRDQHEIALWAARQTPESIDAMQKDLEATLLERLIFTNAPTPLSQYPTTRIGPTSFPG